MRYPMELDITGRCCVIVGGGAVAERKVGPLLAAGADVTVIAPQLTAGLAAWRDEGRLRHEAVVYRPGILKDMARRPFLVFAATDDRDVNAAVYAEGRATGALVNVATAMGAPHSDFTVPAMLRRGRLSVSVATEGLSPALSRALRLELEQQLPESLGEWLERVANLRSELKEKMKTQPERQAFWRRVLNKDIMELVRQGDLDQAEVMIRNAASGIGIEP